MMDVLKQAAVRACGTDQLRRAGLRSGHLEQDGLQRQACRIAEFASKRLAQRVDNLIRIDASASADHIDQRVTVDQRTREGADVRNLLFPGQHGNPEIDETGVAKRVLDRKSVV